MTLNIFITLIFRIRRINIDLLIHKTFFISLRKKILTIMSSKEKKSVDWILLGRDCWREVFSWFSFNERQKIRLVCNKWNLWIIDYKAFWPLDYKEHSTIIKNVREKVLKEHSSNTFQKPFRSILVSNFIFLVDAIINRVYERFLIISRDSFALLLEYKHKFEQLYFSKNYFLSKDEHGLCCLIEFNHIKEPEEKVFIIKETYIDLKDCGNVYAFSYPFLLARTLCDKEKYILRNLETGEDILENNTDGLLPVFCEISENYILIICHSNNNVIIYSFKLDNIKRKPIKTVVPQYDTFELKDHLFFLIHKNKPSSWIRVLNLETGKQTIVETNNMNICLVFKSIVTTLENNCISIYRWNHDYTKLELVKKTNENYQYFEIDCFHPTLSFFSLLSYQNNGSSLFIYSKADNKQQMVITLPNNHKSFVGDTRSRIYWKYVENGSTYLRMIDFSSNENLLQ